MAVLWVLGRINLAFCLRADSPLMNNLFSHYIFLSCMKEMSWLTERPCAPLFLYLYDSHHRRKTLTLDYLLLRRGAVSDVEGQLWPGLEIHPMVVLEVRARVDKQSPSVVFRVWNTLCALFVNHCPYTQQRNFCTLEELLLSLFLISYHQMAQLGLLCKQCCFPGCKHLHFCYC